MVKCKIYILKKILWKIIKAAALFLLPVFERLEVCMKVDIDKWDVEVDQNILPYLCTYFFSVFFTLIGLGYRRGCYLVGKTIY